MENNNVQQRPRTWRIHGKDDFSKFLEFYPDLVTERIVSAKVSHKNANDRVYWLLNEDGEVKNAYQTLFGAPTRKDVDVEYYND